MLLSLKEIRIEKIKILNIKIIIKRSRRKDRTNLIRIVNDLKTISLKIISRRILARFNVIIIRNTITILIFIFN